MKKILSLLLVFSLSACNGFEYELKPSAVKPEEPSPLELTPRGLARMFSELPLETAHLQEVYDAVVHSSDNGYDEEYTMDCLVSNPGSGVGDAPGTRAHDSYQKPLRNLIRDYLSGRATTKSSVEDMLSAISESGFQLYWPYSEDWDGTTFPIITFDPGSGLETNYGYEITLAPGGARIVDSVYVDEALAMERPVWVFNSNSDAGFTPLELLAEEPASPEPDVQAAAAKQEAGQGRKLGTGSPAAGTSSRQRRLMLKSFKMLRNYDSWFGGASEFFVKCGCVEGFTASTDAELKLYSPSVTDFMIVVKRKYVGKELPYEAILVTDFTSQVDKLAFLVVEDDGGTRTSWKGEAVVKIQSKSYGISLDIPYNEKDDIVWRGQLSGRFFEEEDVVTGRFGDVVISFELD